MKHFFERLIQAISAQNWGRPSRAQRRMSLKMKGRKNSAGDWYGSANLPKRARLERKLEREIWGKI